MIFYKVTAIALIASFVVWLLKKPSIKQDFQKERRKGVLSKNGEDKAVLAIVIMFVFIAILIAGCANA